ncbi:YolD-like family protein [Paenibacillus sp. LPE1-1-1.1]|uniref:YolD-like family protein n=1 Tax=Paenibacillus sp. LPE1-1-1.1 TaxID=3135230 RepID=UPI0034242921
MMYTLLKGTVFSLSKKLTGNGFWESSRMMLPEYKSRIIELAQQQKKRDRIQLDEQEWESISQAVGDSLSHRKEIVLKCTIP